MDWDDAYANAAHIEGGSGFPRLWQRKAAAFRDRLGARAQLDIAYGSVPAERLDLFLPEGDPHGLAVYVHGGYWQLTGKHYWSHLAGGMVERGWAVAVPGYTLCPGIRVRGITRQVAAAMTRAAGLVAGPIRLAGSSAGGHLATRMVCEDSPLTPSVLERIVRVVSISGVHDLRPLLRTRLNEALRMDVEEARAESPVLSAPHEGVRVTCWAGEDERPEFRRQNALLANIWFGLGAETAVVEEPHRHHFNVIEGLETAQGALTRALLG